MVRRKGGEEGEESHIPGAKRRLIRSQWSLVFKKDLGREAGTPPRPGKGLDSNLKNAKCSSARGPGTFLSESRAVPLGVKKGGRRSSYLNNHPPIRGASLGNWEICLS